MRGEVLRQGFGPAWLVRVAALGPASAIDGPLAEPALLAHPRVTPIVIAALGDDPIVGRVALGAAVAEALAALPGRASLFGDPHLDARLPAVGLALYVPLTASTLRVDGALLALDAGDAVLVDSRVPIAAPVGAPALLVVYYRHWFREPVAPIDAPPVSISLFRYRRLPVAQRRLFTWRFDRYLRLRPRLLAAAVMRRVRGAVTGEQP